MTPSHGTKLEIIGIYFLPPGVSPRYPRASDFVKSDTVQAAWIKTESIHPQALLKNVAIECIVRTDTHLQPLYFRQAEMTSQQFQSVLDCCSSSPENPSVRITQCWLKLFPGSVTDSWGDPFTPK